MLRLGIGAALVVAVLGAAFFAGDRYGWSARKYKQCQIETARRNQAIEDANAEATRQEEIDEEARRIQLEQFAACPGAQSCILTKGTVQCLDLLSQ